MTPVPIYFHVVEGQRLDKLVQCEDIRADEKNLKRKSLNKNSPAISSLINPSSLSIEPHLSPLSAVVVGAIETVVDEKKNASELRLCPPFIIWVLVCDVVVGIHSCP